MVENVFTLTNVPSSKNVCQNFDDPDIFVEISTKNQDSQNFDEC